MTYYVALDVGARSLALCIVDSEGGVQQYLKRVSNCIWPMGGAMRNHPNSFCRQLILRTILQLFLAMALEQYAWASNQSDIEIVPVTGHSWVRSIAFSPDGSLVLSASKIDKNAKLWDVESGRLIRTYEGDAQVETVAFSSDGNSAFLGSTRGRIKVLDVTTGRQTPGFPGSYFALSPDGTRLFAINATHLRLFDIEKGKLIRSINYEKFKGLNHPLDFGNSIAFSPDGSKVVTGHSQSIRLWDVKSGELVRSFEEYADWTPQVTLSDGKNIDKEITKLNSINGVTSVAFSPDGNFILSGHGSWSNPSDSDIKRNNTVKLWDTKTGQLIHSFEGHSGQISSVAFSPDGNRAISGSWDKTLKLWDVKNTRLILSITKKKPITSAAFSPDGNRVLIGTTGNSIELFDTNSGHLIRTFKGQSSPVQTVSYSNNGGQILSSSGRTLKLWDSATGSLTKTYEGNASEVVSAAFSPGANRLLLGSRDNVLRLLDAATNRLIHTFDVEFNFNIEFGPVPTVAFSSDSQFILSGSSNGVVKMWNADSGHFIRNFEGLTDRAISVAFSPDSTHVLAGSGPLHSKLRLWDTKSGRLIHSFIDERLNSRADAHHRNSSHLRTIRSVAFSPNGKNIVSGGGNLIKLWDTKNGRLIRTLADESLRAGTFLGGKIQNYSHPEEVRSVAFSPNGSQIVSGGAGNLIKLWNATSGQLLRTFEGHSAPVQSVAFSPDGTRIISGSLDTTIRIWLTKTGEQLAILMSGREDDWLAMTSDGFFTTSGSGSEMLSIVRGLKVTAVDQVFDYLYRPDLVEEMLKGDPESKHSEAARTLNLIRFLDSGPAPQLNTIQKKTERAGNTIKVTARIVDSGGGIGSRVIWRINGNTSGRVEPKELQGAEIPDPGKSLNLTETFKLDPSRTNTIELVAYNGAGLVASPPLKLIVDRFGVTERSRPKMHVLSIGIDNYRMPDYRLKYAANDAKTFSKALRVVGSELFSDIRTITLTDNQVTEARINLAFEKISADVNPKDVFVLFLSGHGKSIDGRYYFYPQTLDFKAGQRVKENGIGQDKWQTWLAKVGAQKSLLIIDTCESSAAGGLVRGVESARKTAMDQLQYATGRNLIAASRQAAFEGYKGHGVLTYALLEALNTDKDSDERIKVGSLADHVDERVPIISRELFGVYQKPTRKLSGNDFPIGLRRKVLTAIDVTGAIPETPTHVVIRGERVREKALFDAPSQLELIPGTQVFVVKFVGNDWALIAKNRQKLGYVPVKSLLKLVN